MFHNILICFWHICFRNLSPLIYCDTGNPLQVYMLLKKHFSNVFSSYFWLWLNILLKGMIYFECNMLIDVKAFICCFSNKVVKQNWDQEQKM